MHISVSQAKTFSDCNMKWYMDKVKKIRPPQTVALEFGSLFHELMERLANEEPYEELFLQSEMLKKIFERNEEYLLTLKDKKGLVEEEIKEPLIDKIDFLGYIDFLVLEEDKIIVEDYKTVGDWRWALTTDNLGADEQLNIYAYFVKKIFNDHRPIHLRHIQFNKKTSNKKIITVPYNHEFGKGIYDWICLKALAIKELKNKKINEVEKTRSSCGKYGGCPYRDYCDGKSSLKELKDMYNPNIKERSSEELDNMTPEERVEEVAKEQNFNKLLNGDKQMNIKERMASLRKSNKEKADDHKNAGENIPSQESPKNGDTIGGENIMVDKPTPKSEKPAKKSPRKTKKVSGKPLVFVGCNILEEKIPFLSELVHDIYIKPVLEEHKVPFAACVDFGKWKAPLYLQANQIIDFLKEQEAFVVDHKRPVDSFINTLISEAGRQEEFRFIRSVF